MLVRLAKLGDVYGLPLLKDHVKFLKNQVWSAKSHIVQRCQNPIICRWLRNIDIDKATFEWLT